MKINRSYILLISLISIFLLLSISAASAASDVDDVASNVAIDDITEFEDIDNNANNVEILSQNEENFISDEPVIIGGDEDGGNGDEPVSDAIPTTIDAENKTLKFGENITVNFTLKDNESQNISDVNASNFKVYYKNATEEEFNYSKTLKFTIKDNQFVFSQQLPVQDYILKIKFINSTIGDKNYTESEVDVELNITKTGTRFNATETKIKVTDDIIIPFKIYIDANKTLNVNASRLNVTCEDMELSFTNTTGGTNITNGIKITNLTKEVGEYQIKIQYLGNDNCNPSETIITLKILENNTVTIIDNITVDNQTNNVTIPISVNSNGTILNITSGDILLVLVYDNGTEKKTVEITNETGLGFVGENGTYNVSFIRNVPFNDAKLTIVYKNNTQSEANTTISFIENCTIITDAIIKFNNHTCNVTIPISVNYTATTTYEVNGKSKTDGDVTVLNITRSDISLILSYFDEVENKTVNATIDSFELLGDNGTYNISFVDNSHPLDNATLIIIFANNTLNETSKNVTLKGIYDLVIVPVNVTADYQDSEFVFLVKDANNDTALPNINITASGLWFYTFGNTSSLSGSKVFTTDADGYLRIKNENMHPNLDITGYTNGYVALPVGSYNLTFKANDPLVLDNTTKITVNKVQAKIVASNAVGEFGTVTTYSFQVVNSKTNEPIKLVDAIFRIYAGDLDATRTGATNKTGYYTSPNLNLTANKYNLQLKVNSTNVVCSAVTKTLTINKRNATIDVNSRTVYYGVLDDIVATVKDKKTGKVLKNTYVLVKLYSTTKKYINYAVATNKKGVLSFSPPSNLKVGKHKFTITVLDNNYQSTTYTRYVTIKKAYGYFSAKNVKTYYRSGKLFKVKLINKKTKKGINGAKVIAKVYISKKKYYKYAGNTTKYGILQFKINYKPGTYKVVVSNNGDKGYSAKKITKKIRVTKHPLRFKALNLKVRKGKYFRVKVISKKTKKGKSSVKVKIKVYTGKKYKTYTKKSNKKGIAYLKMKKLGKHKVIVSVKYPKLYTAKKLKKTVRVRRKK